MTIGELAEALGAERTTLTRNLALIEGASWVEIRPAEADARSRIVTVTDKGRAVVEGAFPPGARLKTSPARRLARMARPRCGSWPARHCIRDETVGHLCSQ